jgi:hypothetical protein
MEAMTRRYCLRHQDVFAIQAWSKSFSPPSPRRYSDDTAILSDLTF